jgi:hypothetical protein
MHIPKEAEPLLQMLLEDVAQFAMEMQHRMMMTPNSDWYGLVALSSHFDRFDPFDGSMGWLRYCVMCGRVFSEIAGLEHENWIDRIEVAVDAVWGLTFDIRGPLPEAQVSQIINSALRGDNLEIDYDCNEEEETENAWKLAVVYVAESFDRQTNEHYDEKAYNKLGKRIYQDALTTLRLRERLREDLRAQEDAEDSDDPEDDGPERRHA